MKEKRLRIKVDVDIAKMTVITLLIFIIMVSVNGKFLNPMNLTSMCFQLPELGFYSLAMMMTMLSNGIDLSVVSIGNLSAICAATIMKQAVDKGLTGVALIWICNFGNGSGIGCRCIFGFFNGFVIANLNLAPMLSTMATQTFIKGISIIITQGKSVSGAPKTICIFWIVYFTWNTIYNVDSYIGICSNWTFIVQDEIWV